MRKIKLFPHQIDALEQTKDKDHVAYYLDMGLGKTFVGSEKMMQLGAKVNLVICQKSKINDWLEHFEVNYDYVVIINLTEKNTIELFTTWDFEFPCVGVINYELAFRRPALKKLTDFTLMLDESSMIQNEQAKRSKFILKLQPKNVILLSGTPTGGKYEKLWSQCHLLGWPISKKTYWNQFINTEIMDFNGFPIKIVKGYKNVERLKDKLRQHGAVFMKSDEVFDLPQQVDTTINVSTTKEYRKFRKDSIISLNTYKNQFVEWDGKDDSDFYGKDVTPHIELVGDTTLTKMLYERQLCGQYNKEKLEAFRDLVESTNDRLIVFYNFNDELEKLEGVCGSLDRPMSIVNGQIKDLTRYDLCEDTITFIQYQAGAMGLNLQKANKIVYFTPPLSSELFEQSKKRIHRIGQYRSCFYYYLTCRGSIEEKIYTTLAMRKDYTERLFENEESN